MGFFFFLFLDYELAAFISHMGTSTNVGHYVCHIKKEGRWVIFNDEKVAVSENPPFELGYLYLYRRLSQWSLKLYFLPFHLIWLIILFLT